MARYSSLKVRYCKTVVLLVLSLNINQASGCPSLCQCGEQPIGSRYVDCHNVNFTTLPSDIPKDTVSLFLTNTKITSLSANYFSRLSNLTKIELSNNRIENITDGVFDGLTKLETLNLPSNGIRRISKNAFVGLTSLTKLSLSNNELTTLPKDLLKFQTRLQTLNLDNNLLDALPTGFLNRTLLTSLHLNTNRLTKVSNDMFERQTKLSMLYLNKNQIDNIEEKAFMAAGSSLIVVSLESNKISSFPKALYEIKGPIILEIRLDNNLLKLIPQEAKSFFDKVKQSRGKIRLSGNSLVCTKNLQWLQSWVNQNKNVIKDIDQVLCTTLDGKHVKLIEYDFNSTVSPSSNSTSTVIASTLTPTSTIQTTKSLLTTLKQQTTTISQTPSTIKTKLFYDSSTSSNGVLSTTEALTSTIDVVTRMSENVTSTQQIPVTGLPSSSNISHNMSVLTNPTNKTDEAKTTTLNKSEYIILATCLSAAFIAVVVFIAMYCFRDKIIKRDKVLSSRYDRVRIV